MVFAESGEAIFCGFQRGGDDAAPDLFRYEEWRGVLGGTGASRRSAGFVSLSRMQMYPCAVGLPADTQIVRFSLPVCCNVVGGASPRRMEMRPHAVPGEHSPCAHPVHFSPPAHCHATGFILPNCSCVCCRATNFPPLRKMQTRPHAVPGEYSPCAHPMHFSPPAHCYAAGFISPCRMEMYLRPVPRRILPIGQLAHFSLSRHRFYFAMRTRSWVVTGGLHFTGQTMHFPLSAHCLAVGFISPRRMEMRSWVVMRDFQPVLSLFVSRRLFAAM